MYVLRRTLEGREPHRSMEPLGATQSQGLVADRKSHYSATGSESCSSRDSIVLAVDARRTKQCAASWLLKRSIRSCDTGKLRRLTEPAAAFHNRTAVAHQMRRTTLLSSDNSRVQPLPASKG